MPKSKQMRRARSADKIHNDWQSQPDDKRRRKTRRESSDVESLPSNLVGNDVDTNHLDEIIDSVISQTCGNDQPEGESVDPARTEELKNTERITATSTLVVNALRYLKNCRRIPMNFSE